MKLEYKQIHNAILEVLKNDSNYDGIDINNLIAINKIRLDELLYLLYYRKMSVDIN